MENRRFYSGVAAEVALHHVLAPSIKPLCVSSFACQHVLACLKLGYTGIPAKWLFYQEEWMIIQLIWGHDSQTKLFSANAIGHTADMWPLQASDYHAAHGLHSGNAIRRSAGLEIEFHFLQFCNFHTQPLMSLMHHFTTISPPLVRRH